MSRDPASILYNDAGEPIATMDINGGVRLLVQVDDFGLAVDLEQVPNVRALTRFSEVDDVDSNDGRVDIWPPRTLRVVPTEARIHDISSDDPADTGRICMVVGLVADFSKLVEFVAVGSSTVAEFAEVLSLIMVGDEDVTTKNTGNISAIAQVDGTLSSYIDADGGRSLQSPYVVRLGATLHVTQLMVSLDKAGNISGARATLTLKTRKRDPIGPWLRHASVPISLTGNSPFNMRFDPPVTVPEKNELKVEVESVTDNNSRLTSYMGGYVVDNSPLLTP